MILYIDFYQNRSSIVEVMIKNFGVFFYAPQCREIQHGERGYRSLVRRVTGSNAQ